MNIIKLEENGLMTNDLVFAKVRPDAIIPTKDTENAGYDIYANFDEDYLVIPPHSTVLVPTGIASAMTDNYYLQVHERGSTGKIGMKYSAGVVDSSYRGEIFVALSNINGTEIIISKLSKEELIDQYGERDRYHTEDVILRYGKEDYQRAYLIDATSNPEDGIEAIIYPYTKAIAQLVVHEVPKMNVIEVTYNDLQKIPSKRGIGALGSSGK